MESVDGLYPLGFTSRIALASALRHVTIMKRRIVLKILLVLAGTLILFQCRLPTSVAAAVEFAPGVGADADQPVIKELVAAFNEAEVAVRKADLDALMTACFCMTTSRPPRRRATCITELLPKTRS